MTTCPRQPAVSAALARRAATLLSHLTCEERRSHHDPFNNIPETGPKNKRIEAVTCLGLGLGQWKEILRPIHPFASGSGYEHITYMHNNYVYPKTDTTGRQKGNTH